MRARSLNLFPFFCGTQLTGGDICSVSEMMESYLHDVQDTFFAVPDSQLPPDGSMHNLMDTPISFVP